MKEFFDRHKRIALQFSGGKDSLAVLFLLKPYWHCLTVYFCNSGNPFPETLALIDQIRSLVPHFVEIQGFQPQVLRQFGWPSDLVPANSMPMAKIAGTHDQPLIDKYSCCFHSIMKPMHDQMKTDGITLIIRGQRNADAVKPPIRTGNVVDGFEFLNPIEDWSDQQVFDFLADVGSPIPQYYRDGMTSAPDCMNCTAWLEHKMPAYVRRHHPKHYPILIERINTISATVKPYFDELLAVQEQE